MWEADYTDAGQLACPSGAGNLVVSPDGRRVFVSVVQQAPSPGPADAAANNTSAVATLAYDAATGAATWQSLYQQTPEDSSQLDVAPDGSAIYVAAEHGLCSDCAPPPQFVTVAYDTTDGRQKWQAVYGNAYSAARALVAMPGTGRVVVLGEEEQCGVLDLSSPQAQAIVAVAYEPGGAASLPGIGGSAPPAAANCDAGPVVSVPEGPVAAMPLVGGPALCAALMRRRRKAGPRAPIGSCNKRSRARSY